MPLAISFLFFLPFIILGAVLLVMLVLFLLARIQNGRFLRPIVTQLSKIPFMRRWFQKMSVAAYERSNPELAGAIKKMQSFGEIKTPEQAQRALAVMTPARAQGVPGARRRAGRDARAREPRPAAARRARRPGDDRAAEARGQRGKGRRSAEDGSGRGPLLASAQRLRASDRAHRYR